MSKGCNIQEFKVGDTSVGDGLTLNPKMIVRKLLKNRYLVMGWFGQGHNSQGTLCPRDATSKNFRSGTHRSGTD
jgi:hypothetical protein